MLSPFPGWWQHTPILAEHGHRLLGAIVGVLTVALAGWIWKVDPRPGVRGLAVMGVVVVIFQGVLGGLRVVLVSLDLAVVHALMAQVYFGLLVSLAVMTSGGWINRPDNPEISADRRSLGRLASLAAVAVFVQIGLGTLLRHPGQGLNVALVVAHIIGAVAVFALIFLLIRSGLDEHGHDARLRHGLMWLMFVLTIQVTLGLTAYFVLLNESGILIPSNLQVIINSLHVVVGAILWGITVAVTIWCNGVDTPSTKEKHAE